MVLPVVARQNASEFPEVRNCKGGRDIQILLKSLVIIFAFVALASCNVLDMQDSSRDPKYAGLIGKRARTKVDLWATGVTMDQNYKKRLDYIILVPDPGFGGPEVLGRTRFGKNAIVRITHVLTASYLGITRVQYVAEELGSERLGGAEILIGVTGVTDDENMGLDKEIYEWLD